MGIGEKSSINHYLKIQPIQLEVIHIKIKEINCEGIHFLV